MCKFFVMYFYDEEATDPCYFLDMCAPMQEHGANRHALGFNHPAYRAAYPAYRATYPYRAGTDGRNNGQITEDKHPRYKRGLRLLRELSSVSLRSGPCHDLILEDRRW